jgi:hypothetical protein
MHSMEAIGTTNRHLRVVHHKERRSDGVVCVYDKFVIIETSTLFGEDLLHIDQDSKLVDHG